MRKSNVIKKELEKFKNLLNDSKEQDEIDFMEGKIKLTEAELEKALEAESKTPAKKATTKKTSTKKSTKKKQEKKPKTKKPAVVKEQKSVEYKGKVYLQSDPEFCDILTKKWEERKAKQKKSSGKRKTRSVMQQIASNVASTVVKGIKSIDKEDLEKSPKSELNKIERFEKAAKEFVDSCEAFVGDELSKKEVKEEFEGVDKIINSIRDKYIKKMAKGGSVKNKKNRIIRNQQDIERVFGTDNVTDIEETEEGNYIVQGDLEQIKAIAKRENINIEEVENWGIRIWVESYAKGGSTYADGGEMVYHDREDFYEKNPSFPRRIEITKEQYIKNKDFISKQKWGSNIVDTMGYEDNNGVEFIEFDIEVGEKSSWDMYSWINENIPSSDRKIFVQDKKFLSFAKGGSTYADGGNILSENEVYKIKRGMTRKDIEEMLNKHFPDSFEFRVYHPETSGHHNYPTLKGDIKKDGLDGIQDDKLKFYFTDKDSNSSRTLNYEVSQGSENTYYDFRLYDDDYNPYVGHFGFKDDGDVDSSYITKFISFLQDAYETPFTVKHKVMAEGGKTDHSVQDMFIKKVGKNDYQVLNENKVVSLTGNRDFIVKYIRDNQWNNFYSHLDQKGLEKMVDEKAANGEPVLIDNLPFAKGGSTSVKGGRIVGGYYYDTRYGKPFQVISVDGNKMGIQYLDLKNNKREDITSIDKSEFDYYVENKAWNKYVNPTSIESFKSAFAEGGSTDKFVRLKFNSHKKHNPNYDILEGHLDKDSFITYTIAVKGNNVGKESMEYYGGQNYVVGSNKRSSSRHYNVSDIPEKYKSSWLELKRLYNLNYKNK